MKNYVIFIVVALLYITMSLFSCEGEGNEKKVSTYQGTKSHYTGDDCMTCHQSGGEGEGWFNVAGTVYKDTLGTNVFPNVTIKLFAAENGNGGEVGVIEVDGLGNFYTTENIDFTAGLFPAVMSDNGMKYMSTSVNTGRCNSCHGVSTKKLWIGE